MNRYISTILLISVESLNKKSYQLLNAYPLYHVSQRKLTFSDFISTELRFKNLISDTP